VVSYFAMWSRIRRAKTWWLKIARAGGAVCLCSLASRQTASQPEDYDEARDLMNRFEMSVFSKCMDSSLSPPTEQYYFVGPVLVPTRNTVRSIPTVVEYQDAQFYLGLKTGRRKYRDNPKR